MELVRGDGDVPACLLVQFNVAVPVAVLAESGTGDSVEPVVAGAWEYDFDLAGLLVVMLGGERVRVRFPTVVVGWG